MGRYVIYKVDGSVYRVLAKISENLWQILSATGEVLDVSPKMLESL